MHPPTSSMNREPIACDTIDIAAFLGLAAVLGAAAGACFALVAKVAPPDKVGAVAGFVGAAGGLGGFFPPLVMGAVYSRLDDYSIGFLLLALTAAVAAAYTWRAMRPAVLHV